MKNVLLRLKLKSFGVRQRECIRAIEGENLGTNPALNDYLSKLEGKYASLTAESLP